MEFDREAVKERLLAAIKVSDKGGCWEFQKSLRGGGYGRLKVLGKFYAAHRLSYEVFVSPIVGGLLVCHKCDNRKCINPDHLFLGTYSDNIKDAYQKGRKVAPVSQFKKGAEPYNKTYTEGELLEAIKEIYNNPSESIASVCRRLCFNYQSMTRWRRKERDTNLKNICG